RLKKDSEPGGTVRYVRQIDFVLGEHVSHNGLGIASNCVSAQRSGADGRLTGEAGNDMVLSQDNRFVDTRTPSTPHEVDRDTMQASPELGRHASHVSRIMS